jgi:hypothetical protein
VSKSAFVFVSQPTKLTAAQIVVRDWLFVQLDQVGLVPRTVGISDYAPKNPLQEVCILAKHCSGGLVLGFEQLRIETGRSKPGTAQETAVSDQAQASPWNQLEAGILTAMRLPLLVVREPGINGGVFDPGASDHYVNTIDSAQFAGGGADEALGEALRTWANDVWAYYRNVW